MNNLLCCELNPYVVCRECGEKICAEHVRLADGSANNGIFFTSHPWSGHGPTICRYTGIKLSGKWDDSNLFECYKDI